MENEEMNSHDETAQQVEPTSGEAQGEVQESTAASPPVEGIEPKPKSWLQKSWPWFAAVLASLLAGAALVFFLLYLPADATRRQAQSDLSGVRETLAAAETKAADLEGELAGATSRLENAQAELQTVKLSLAVSRLQANISYARLALINKDVLTARQELSDAEANLAELSLLLEDSDTSSALADRLKTIRANLTSDPARALDEMRTLGENLARLENR